LCVGETEAERSAGQAREVIIRQLQAPLAGLSPTQIGRLVIAYEPVWAIGSGLAATALDARTTAAMIRTYAATVESTGATSIRILYGGSVATSNAADIFAGDDVDGLLVGGASLDAATFTEICRAVSAAEQ